MKTIPLRTIVTDIATKVKGSLHHLQVEMGGQIFYNFVPMGMHADTKGPLKGQWLVPERIQTNVNAVDVDLPLDVLGTQISNTESGFKGMATSLTLHANGCIHVQIQPAGTLKSGEIIKSYDFDIRECTGKALEKLSKIERAASEKAKPSPSPVEPYSPAAIE